MLLATALLIIGLLLVVYGADRLVFAASILCRSFGVPPLLIGLTVVSIGTSLPELLVASSAALNGQLNLAVGTALGSNITNILLILGLAALLHPFTVNSDILRRELPLMLVVSGVIGWLLFDNQLSRIDGVVLIAVAVAYLLFTIKIARLAGNEGADNLTREQLAELPREGSRPVAFLWLAVALIIMPMATRMVIDNASVRRALLWRERACDWPDDYSVGTSLPELATTIAGARKGEDDIAIGNIIGSNIFNIVLVLGIPALIAPGEIDPHAFARDYWVMLVVSAIFAVLCWRKSSLYRQGSRCSVNM